MNELNALFRKRIHLPGSETITFEVLDNVLARTAKAIPFENLRIIENKTSVISKPYLVNKILVNNEGGLCYEINPMFYLFLIDNGFDAVLTRGVVYNNDTESYLTFGRTHVTILLTHKGQTYLIDTGFGGNLPLKPVPLSGETITSSNGQFRVQRSNGELGDYVLEMKLKHKDTDWKIGYTFDSRKPVTDLSECNAVQKIIVEHTESSFNKHPLITKLTDGGNLTLTNTSFTHWDHGIVTKEKIDRVRYKELLKEHFGI
ncbi:arylamine N-acetyltransferase family protein [Paenibacillus eucommiae]|uniref:N-hydroxyarylamine O-acetyltransferase n=1 Tax=Paenibacillus eucommiae TaxID=1355755 RepID=A0ABS4J850_9BACL|nr:arylamine N-acetyltransferase [Paenibacillus eucommiae]MBP1995425.1 N-hydroxyarylamine O-acetyltransferase [Paenibacillus eucommiae]